MIEQFSWLRSRWTGYAAAALSVAIGVGCFYVLRQWFTAPYVIPFMMAVAFSTLFGLGPGFAALVLAIVVSDYLSVQGMGILGGSGAAVNRLAINHVTWIAGGSYGAVLLFTHVGEQYIRRKIAHSFLLPDIGAKQDEDIHTHPHLMGRLDGHVEGELYGWAMDKAQMSIPPKITFYVDERPVGEVLAVHYRPDVKEHSFFFDLSECCLPSSAARVEAKFSNRKRLSNCPLTVKIPRRAEALHSETILFMHIPKTAGTAFREAMIGNYKHSQVAYVYPHPPGFLVSNLGLLPLEQRARFRLVMGHFQYGIHEFLPQEYTYVTIVRDPVERVISHYNYLRQTQPDIVSEGGSTLSLPEMLEGQRTANIDNLMVRCFSGLDKNDVRPGHLDQGAYDLAIDHLRTKFKFVGYQDRADEAYTALQKQFNWKDRGSLAVVNQGERSSATVDEATRRIIERFNKWDCRLYSKIRELFP
ncbi:MAG: sulfotransferase family 2 domain-containing protein [Bryobacteraceae bacterium]